MYTVITIDHKLFKFDKFGYRVHSLNQFPIDRRLGVAQYKAVVQQIVSPQKLCDTFPIEHPGFDLANPVHLAAFSKEAFVYPGYIFAIGEACQLGKGFIVGQLDRDKLAQDVYLPSWVADHGDPRCKMNSEGFPAGTGILLVSKI